MLEFVKRIFRLRTVDEKVLIDSENKYRTLVESLIEGIGIVDDNGNYKGAFGLFTDITEHKKFEAKREMIIKELEKKISDANHNASGFLPICASCHSIRDIDNIWHSVADYIADHTNIQFTHTICPGCKDELYGSDKNKIKFRRSDK